MDWLPIIIIILEQNKNWQFIWKSVGTINSSGQQYSSLPPRYYSFCKSILVTLILEGNKIKATLLQSYYHYNFF